MVICPYRWNGTWVFDDEGAGLHREPFVAGIDTIIDRLTVDIPDAKRGFRMVFSAAPFPGHTVRLEWRREESGGNWYHCPQLSMEGWLCPAMFKYFETTPPEIFAKFDPLPPNSPSADQHKRRGSPG
ncbi:MAG: hypothetical protein IT577_13955 [Verrucomicrobiae bacterium]|nr:hypothetical protein [Verrucomicrobiae bacterium]